MEWVLVDFIIKLLKSKNLIIKIEYNLIFTIINKFIKYFYIILFKKYIYNKTTKNNSIWQIDKVL